MVIKTVVCCDHCGQQMEFKDGVAIRLDGLGAEMHWYHKDKLIANSQESMHFCCIDCLVAFMERSSD